MIPSMRSRSFQTLFLSCGVSLAVLGSAGVARADDPPAPNAAAAASPEKLAEAKRQFEAGVSLLEDPDGAKYEEAYRAFKKAYELSQSPKVLGNIAFCALHLERDGEAIDSYTTYLRDVPDVSERERAQIQRDLPTMMATIARVRVVAKTAAKGAVIIDRRTQTRGAPVENAYPLEGNEALLRLRPGRHTLVVRAGNVDSMPFEATLEPGSEITFTPQEAAPRRAEEPAPVASSSPSLVGPITVGVLGVVALGVGIGTGLAAKSKTSDIEKNCPADVCPGTYDLAGERSSAKTLGTVADVSFIAGGALVAGAVVWYFLTPKESAARPAGITARALTARPSAMCTADGCGFNVVGGF
jgi:hypothetical protein